MKLALNKNDIVSIDTAPLIASLSKTGKTVRCTVLLPSPESADQMYVLPDGKNNALYVSKFWFVKL